MDGVVAVVARLNIGHFRKLLAKEADEEKRRLLANLLAEEEAKLAKANEDAKRQKQG